jgi:glucose-6-phosphate isomerase
MSIVDRHCQETTIDRNICIQMALLRIWASICQKRRAIIIINHDDLQSLGRIILSNMCEDV